MPDQENNADRKTGEKTTVEPRSSQELKKLAMDIVDGKVFTSDMIETGDFENVLIVGDIFKPLMFMDKKARQKLVDEEVVLLYE